MRGLAEFHEMVQCLEGTSSGKEKAEILEIYLKNGDYIRGYLDAAYNPFVQYFVSSKVALAKGSQEGLFSLSGPLEMKLPVVLHAFSERHITGQEAYNTWVKLLQTVQHEHRYLLNRILDKDLKCRTGLKTINKVLRKLKMPEIETHEVCLGHLWEGEAVWDDDYTWYMSRKLDGIRCNAILKDGKVTLISRQGKAFETLKVLEEALSGYTGPDCILDGELALRTEDGADDFAGLMQRIRRKNHQIENVVFHVFDYIPLYAGKERCFAERLFELADVLSIIGSPLLKPVKQKRVKSQDHFFKMRQKAMDKGWEGLMLRKNTPYKQGRTKDLYKVKTMREGEWRVIGIEEGEMAVVVDGHQKTIPVLARANIKHKGSIVGVGSGWSLKERKYYLAHPEELIGKVITVQYFEVTRNKEGGYGLRFPVFKCLHGDNRDT